MAANLPDVSSKYGAPMGRRSETPDAGAPVPFKFTLRRVYINSGGYDSGGAYWGFGAPLYQAEGEAQVRGEDWPAQVFYLRAYSRESAKAQVLTKYPGARFYR